MIGTDKSVPFQTAEFFRSLLMPQTDSGTRKRAMKPNSPRTGLSDNAIAALAYFTPIMPVFFLALRYYNKRPYVRFHAWQSLVFNVYTLLLGYILVFVLRQATFLGPRILLGVMCVAAVLIFLVWLWCVIGAWSGRRVKLPIIGNWADKQGYR